MPKDRGLTQDALRHITASLFLITKTGNHGKKLVWFDWFREMRLKASEQCAPAISSARISGK